jgi:hypothetical protein
MSEPGFDIIFRGDIVFGQSVVEVKQRLQQLFKADAARIDALFCGRPVPLKRNLDRASAEKYRAVLHKAGIEVELRPAQASAESTTFHTMTAAISIGLPSSSLTFRRPDSKLRTRRLTFFTE